MVATVAGLAVKGQMAADKPPAGPRLSAAEQARLKERDRYAEENEKLRQEGKLPEAIRTGYSGGGG
jgi:hypothetical protein